MKAASVSVAIAVAVSCLAVYAAASHDTCWKGDSDCPPCPAGHTESFDTIIWLGIESTGHVEQFRSAMEKAQKIMRATPGVNNYDPYGIYHTTINYFCCHTPEERSTINNLMKSLPWQPFNLTFAKAQCNAGPGENHLSLYALADDPTQNTLWAFARRIEAAVRAAGVPVNHPRTQAFHCTMGQTELTYPADQVVARLNATFPVFNPTEPITVTWFLGPDWEPIHANTSSSTLAHA